MIEISVIVPTVGRPERLAALLEALARQDLEPEWFEVFVVIDGSSGPSVEALRAAAGRFSSLRWEETGWRRGPATARNVAWRRTTGQIVAMTDDDCLPDPGWLRAIRQRFAEHPEVGLITGCTVTDHDRLTPFSHYVENRSGEGHQTCNSAYRREVLTRLGGFDERFPMAYLEDTDLFCRAIRFTQAQFVSDAVVRHPPREGSMRDVIRSARRFESDFIFFQKDPELYRARHAGWSPPGELFWNVAVKHSLKQLFDQRAWAHRAPLTFVRFASALLFFSLGISLRLPGYCWKYRAPAGSTRACGQESAA